MKLKKDIKRHEDNLTFLKSEENRVDESILQLQGFLFSYYYYFVSVWFHGLLSFCILKPMYLLRDLIMSLLTNTFFSDLCEVSFEQYISGNE